MADSTPRPSIMVVDDQPDNLRLLEDTLTQEGYQVRSLPRGRLALASALQRPPDLVLLDVNMPEMDGYEVCERMAAHASLRRIPVIFLSALSDATDKVRSFQAGAVDYITKPFQVDEVRARVRTHLEVHRLQRELLHHNARLEEVVAERSRQLREANERLRILDRAKADFLTLIAHELRTPLNGLLGVGELLLSGGDGGAEDPELREVFDQSRSRLLALLDDALFLARIEVEAEPFTSRPLSLSSALRVSLARVAELSRTRQVALGPEPVLAGAVLGVETLLERALGALLETAVRLSDPGCVVRLAAVTAPGAVQLVIETCGPCVPAPALPRFFELLSIVEPITSSGDLGLLPYLASRLLAVQGASVAVENRDPPGVRLTVSFQAAGG
jgi:two-component system sensor histidine kinase/response regulator